MKKICTGCGIERDAEQDFTWKYKDRGIRNTRCKFCRSQVSKQHYKNNKQSYISRVRIREVQVIEVCQRKLAEYLAYHPCIDCGQTDIRVLEFDHVRGKKSENISRMVGVVYTYLSSHSCIDCGETDIRVLEFDHVRGKKTLTIARLLDYATSWSTIETEIAKCEVRCANCHRLKTLERGNWWRSALSE